METVKFLFRRFNGKKILLITLRNLIMKKPLLREMTMVFTIVNRYYLYRLIQKYNLSPNNFAYEQNRSTKDLEKKPGNDGWVNIDVLDSKQSKVDVLTSKKHADKVQVVSDSILMEDYLKSHSYLQEDDVTLGKIVF